MTPPPFDIPRPEPRRSLDPVRFCAMTTVALIAWIVSPPVCLMIISGFGLCGGLRESRCVLKRPVLVLGYLGLTFVAGALGFVAHLIGG